MKYPIYNLLLWFLMVLSSISFTIAILLNPSNIIDNLTALGLGWVNMSVLGFIFTYNTLPTNENIEDNNEAL